MLTLLIGKDWKANRQRVLEMIAKDVADEKPGSILIVPELITHDTERRLLEVAGDTCCRYAEVLSFSRLATRVADFCGQSLPECLDNGGRIIAMAAATQQLHSVLKTYASVETQPEFLANLVDTIDELKRCCVTSDDLRKVAAFSDGELAQKLLEISLIQDAYNSICDNGKKDPRDQMTLLLEQLKDSTFGETHTFYIDGFSDFTRQNLAVIEHLILASSNITVSINCDCLNSNLLAFRRASETAREILNIAQQLGVVAEINIVNIKETKLSHITDNLFQGICESSNLDDKLLTCAASSVGQECYAAVERIYSLMRNGARYRDIAVVCPDIKAYQNTIDLVSKQSNLPVYFSGSDNILGTSIISSVLAAIESALGGFELRDVLRYIKSIISPVDISVADKIENYAISWKINGTQWMRIWENHPRGLNKEFNKNDIHQLKKLNSARELALGPLINFYDSFTKATNLKAQIQALYLMLEEIKLSDRLTYLSKNMDLNDNNKDVQILNQVWGTLICALEQVYDLLGNAVLNANTFIRLMRLLLKQYKVGTIPSVLDSIIIGPPDVMRCQQAKHIIVLGALEGKLPGYSGSTSILNDFERLELRKHGVRLSGVALDGLENEFAEIYSVFCGAEESIYISHPPGQPSFIYRRLCAMSGKEVFVESVLGPALVNSTEASALFLRYNYTQGCEKLGIEKFYNELKNRRDFVLGNISQKNVLELYGECPCLSASQIDRLAECRLSYFLKYGLRAKENKAITVDPAEFGVYVHAVLEETAKKVMELGGFHKVSVQQVLEIAEQFSDDYIKNHFAALDTERISYLFQRNKQELIMIVEELWDELRNSKFQPAEFELAFGDNGKLPAIPISGKTIQAKLAGFVDRVDIWQDENTAYYRVVDYKTGKKDFDYCDIYNGIGLQMLLYLFAFEYSGENLLGMPVSPAGVQYFPARVPYISTQGNLADEKLTAEREKQWKRKGLLLRDEAVLDAMDETDNYRRLPCSRNKDGAISGDLADRTQLSLLKTYVFSFLQRLIDDVASGCVDANPYMRGSNYSACSFCPYGAICHKDSVENRRNYKAISAQQFWEGIEKEVSDLG